MSITILLTTNIIFLAILGFFLIKNRQHIKLLKKQLSKAELKFLAEQQKYRQLQEQVSFSMLFDTLTELPSVQVFEDRLTQTINQSKRHALMFAVMCLDIDKFKMINEAFGSEVGDELLRAVAKRLQISIRQLDTLSRFSDDEFILLLPQLTKTETAIYIAQRLLEAISKPFRVQDQDLFITASIGIAIYPVDAENGKSLLKNAQSALSQAKIHGQNAFQFFQSDMQKQSLRELMLSSSLKDPSTYKQFLFYYCPQINTSTQKLIGVDLIPQWQHPEFGMIHTEELTYLLETSRHNLEIDEWICRCALTQFKKWNELGKQLEFITINIALRQLESSQFIYKISQLLQELQLSPNCLVLAIAEGSVLTRFEAIEKSLNMLKHLGVKIAIAHFGSGQLSLQHIKKLAMDYLKIDHSLIRDMADNRESAAIVKMIIAIAKSLHITVIPEGVTCEKQKSLLSELGCDTMQGNYFGPNLIGTESILLPRRRESMVNI